MTWYLEAMALAFWLVIGFAALAAVVVFVLDRSQKADAIRRNYPVIGRFRGLFSTLGEFFRQYFFAMDREELPFNRAQREWVKHASEGGSNTLPFGSTRNISVVGTPIFTPAPFPPLDDQFASSEPMEIGPYARIPYMARSFFNISGMSYGAISKPAVRALSRGARMAGCWMNTGEGALSPYHLEGEADIVFQIGTAKFGVRDADGNLDDESLRAVAAHTQVKMFEIKLAQGAKPGKGGILPAAKITDEIAEIRGLPKGQDGISPNRHKEAGNNAELSGPDRPCARGHRQARGHQDGDGPPRAFPRPLRRDQPPWAGKRAGFHHARRGRGRDRRLAHAADGPCRHVDPRGAAAAGGSAQRDGAEGPHPHRRERQAGEPRRYRLGTGGGADFVTSARGFMFALGCIQALKCHKNTCPTGITTHDPRFQAGAGCRGQGQARRQLREGDREGRGDHRPFRRRVGTAQS
jgi:hypothetical protein